jgi:hypothetical protein
MTSLSPQRYGPLLLGRTGALIACAALVAGCTGAAAQVRLPAKVAATSSAAAPAARPQTPRQQVASAYTGYTAAMASAFNSRSPAMVRQLLRPYLATSTVSNALQAFSSAWSHHEISYGHVVQHIIGIRIAGTAAWVHDCDNTSDAGLAYAGTGQIVPGTLGSAEDNLVTRLDLVRGHWVIGIQTIEDVPCTP